VIKPRFEVNETFTFFVAAMEQQEASEVMLCRPFDLTIVSWLDGEAFDLQHPLQAFMATSTSWQPSISIRLLYPARQCG